MPGASMAEGFWPFVVALVLALAAIVVMVRHANKRFNETGEPFHKFWVGLARPGSAITKPDADMKTPEE